MQENIEPRTRYYRWVIGLFVGYLVCGIVLAVVLYLSITDANAGYPALFFGGLFAAAGLPVFIACAVLAVKSVVKGEPHRLAVVGVLLVCCLFAWVLLRRILQIVWAQLA